MSFNPSTPVMAGGAAGGDRSIFSRTRMCKFHLLGCCQDGENCAYAHAREEMQQRPDLFRTKLCKSLIKNGECTDPMCKFAHNKEELRSSGMLRRSLAGTGRQDQETNMDVKAEPHMVHAVPPTAGKSAPMMRPVMLAPPVSNVQFTPSSSSTSAGGLNASRVRRADIEGRSLLELSASDKQSSSDSDLAKKELKKKLELRKMGATANSNLGMDIPEQHLQHVEEYVENDEGLQEKWATLQANLAQHQERIQRHCDEVHTLVMQRAGVDPQYRQLKRLQIPPIKAHSVSSNSAAVLEHISNTFERITILEAYIRAHGDLITNVPISSGSNDPVKVERGFEGGHR